MLFDEAANMETVVIVGWRSDLIANLLIVDFFTIRPLE